MRRIAIIDHNEHELLIEDVNEQELEEKYGGDEQAYINDNYTFEGDYSWDWITDTQYYPEGDPDPIEVEFKDFI
jgi:hypothetical protein